MIITWRIGLRIALVMIVAIVLQLSFFSYLTIFGTTPNIIPLVAIALGLLAVGYLAGRYREGTEISNTLLPPIMIGALTLAASAGFAAIQLMLGVDTEVSLLVLREIFVQTLLAFLLAIPFYPLIRRVLRPAIVDDVVAGRRMRTTISAAGTRRPRRRGSRRRIPRMRRAT